MLDQPMVFVDLETTGANATTDRITEIGIVEIDQDGVREWSTLVNPGVQIPSFIQGLTGITNDMVAHAPPFEMVAQEALARMQGKLFVAHNARFDYGFLRNEFKRIGIQFTSPVLCTVKLSRKLFPQYHKHSLDALIDRHNLPMEDRHRALADAKALWFFMQYIKKNLSIYIVTAAISMLAQRPALPSDLDPAIIDELPDSHGVYIFYGDEGQALFIGKSSNIRKKVLSHFESGHRHSQDSGLIKQIKRVEWIETVSELGALLCESQIIKTLEPLHNRRLRQSNELCTWQLSEDSNGVVKPNLRYARETNFGYLKQIFGLYQAKKSATNTLIKLAEAHHICLVTLGIENNFQGKPCAAYHKNACMGACVGKEPVSSHNFRLLNAMSKSQVKSWPYNGMVGIMETTTFGSRTDIHLVENWGYAGTVKSESEFHKVVADGIETTFDLDIYKILNKYMDAGKLKIIQFNKSN